MVIAAPNAGVARNSINDQNSIINLKDTSPARDATLPRVEVGPAFLDHDPRRASAPAGAGRGGSPGASRSHIAELLPPGTRWQARAPLARRSARAVVWPEHARPARPMRRIAAGAFAPQNHPSPQLRGAGPLLERATTRQRPARRGHGTGAEHPPERWCPDAGRTKTALDNGLHLRKTAKDTTEAQSNVIIIEQIWSSTAGPVRRNHAEPDRTATTGYASSDHRPSMGCS